MLQIGAMADPNSVTAYNDDAFDDELLSMLCLTLMLETLLFLLDVLLLLLLLLVVVVVVVVETAGACISMLSIPTC